MPTNNHSETMKPDEMAPITETELEKLFESFRPHPSQRFYERMSTAPWTTTSHPVQMLLPTGWPQRVTPVIWSVVGVLLIVLFTFGTRPGQALAEKLAQFFLFAYRDATVIQVTQSTQNAREITFPLSKEEAENLADFVLKEPTFLPPPFEPHGYSYNPLTGAVTLDCSPVESLQLLRITQNKLGSMEAYSTIGASAQVERIVLDSFQGEYVAGAWRSSGLIQALESSPQGPEVSLEANWDPDAKIQMLQWQDSGVHFEILYAAGDPSRIPALEKDSLISIARSMR